MADLLDKAFLKYSTKLLALRRVPGLGGLLHSLSHRVLPPDHLAWFQVRTGLGQGLCLKLRPRTGRDHYEGMVEPALQEVLREYVRPGMVFYDLGANVGFCTLLAARMVEPAGKVFAFEADPEVALRVEENARRNGFSEVHVIPAAVWSSTASVNFSRANVMQSPERGLGRVVSSSDTGERTITVPSVALDDFTRTHPVPDFIKCDVEGAEYEVFLGARKLILEHSPLVACEVHSHQEAELVTRLFQELGYSLSWFTQSHFLGKPKGPA